MSVINPESDVWQHIKATNPSLSALTEYLSLFPPDPRDVHGKKLATKVLSTKFRWKARRCCWKERVGALQLDVRKVEAILGRKTGTSVRGEGRDGMVPSCPHCGSRSLQIISGSLTSKFVSSRLTSNTSRSDCTPETQNSPTRMSFIVKSSHLPSLSCPWWITLYWCTRLTTICIITWLSLPRIRSRRTSAGR